MLYKKYLQRFVALLDQKLEAGYREYSDTSFTEGSELNTIDEMQEECLDICGWGLILWARLERLKEKMYEKWVREDPRD